MTNKNNTSHKLIIKLGTAILALLILILTLSPTATDTRALDNIQPALLAMVDAQPDTTVRVIVYKASTDSALEQLVTELEGTIVRDLQLLNALSVELPAKAIPALARSADVAQINLDGAMVSTSVLTKTVRDEFSDRVYSNNDGTTNWSSNWIEGGENDGPVNGDLRVTRNNELRLKDDGRSLQRAADLTEAETAVLTFDYRRESLDRPSDYIILEISADGGISWTKLDSFVGPANDSDLQSISYNITAHASADTIIRFTTPPTLGNRDYLYVDNLQIEYSIGKPSIDPLPPGDSTDGILRDEFTAVAFDGNNGSTTWMGDWIENDPNALAQDPTSGFVQVLNGELRINNQKSDDAHAGVVRAANLSGFVTNAALSFDFRTSSGVDLTDGISVEVSDDGGVSYILLDTIENISGSSSSRRIYNITRWATPSTMIRIRVAYSYGLDNKYFYLDNVEIIYTARAAPPAKVNRQTVADDFNAYPYTYANQSGSRNWLNDWQEIGENDGGSAGNIHMVNYEGDNRLNMRMDRLTGKETWIANKGIWRTANLSGATRAELSFVYSSSAVESDGILRIEASANGGVTWTEVGQIMGKGSTAITGSDEGWMFAAFDISTFIGPETAVRFITDYSPSDYYDNIYFDDITITFDAPTEVTNTNYYLDTLNVRPTWDMGLDGTGITVVVVDSGIAFDDDFSSLMGLANSSRVVEQVGFNPDSDTVSDNFGHGTHVAGIIGGNGTGSNGAYMGIAPNVNLIGLKVSDENGMAYESDTVAALEWILTYKDKFNIRVVNLSLNSTQEASYNESALDAAVEILWLNDVVVVVSAGNRTSMDEFFNPVLAPPANDPFVITVGASEEWYSTDRNNDFVAGFSAGGITLDGFAKPDIIAPGKDIISVLASSSWWRNDYPDRYVDGGYFRISGTSMSAPMVAGTAALMVQNDPTLTADQIKYRLTSSGSDIFDFVTWQYYPYLDVYAAVTNTTMESANQDVIPHELLAKMALIAYWASSNGDEAIDWATVDWDAVDWDAVDWDAVDWASVNWGSVNWGSVNWGSANWGSVNWAD